jgi:NMD protein affecting ribosome stability and mRNA decay
MKKRVALRNLLSGETQSFPYKDLAPANIIHPEIKSAIILSETRKELQVMDPDTYKTCDITKPLGYTGWGKEAPIIKWDNKIYLLPRD